MDEDFYTKIKRLYDSKKTSTKKLITEALTNLSSRIERKKDELYKEVL